MVKIAVIIINFCSAKLAVEAVESVRTSDLKTHDVEIHLLDNASPGLDPNSLRDAAATRGWGEQVQLYLEDVNHGFGRGNNVVLRALAERPSPPDMVMLLNPDARIERDTLVILADFLDGRPDAGVAGCQIIKPDGAVVAAAFRFPTILGEFADSICFGPVSRRLRAWSIAMSPELPQIEVEWVSGAAMMARFDAIEQAGFFDPEFFLYHEEVDLMWRMRKLGWRMWHVPSARAVHVEGASTGIRSGEAERRRRPAYWYQSWAYYRRKTHGRLRSLGFATARLSGALMNDVIARARGGVPAAPLHFYRDFSAHALTHLLGSRTRPDA